MRFFRITCFSCLSLLLGVLSGNAHAQMPAVKVAVLVNSPPLAYRDTAGKLTGFTTSIVQALCAELALHCELEPARLDAMIDGLVAGQFDVAAIGLLNTPERSQKVLFTRPIYRSTALWFARPGVQPGDPDVRISTFRGSAQENYLKSRRWPIIGALNSAEMVDQLASGVSQAAVVPLMSSFNLQKNPVLRELGIQATVLQVPELSGNASFAINPQRPELREKFDQALEHIKRNGVYDRINSEFIPFRVE